MFGAWSVLVAMMTILLVQGCPFHDNPPGETSIGPLQLHSMMWSDRVSVALKLTEGPVSGDHTCIVSKLHMTQTGQHHDVCTARASLPWQQEKGLPRIATTYKKFTLGTLYDARKQVRVNAMSILSGCCEATKPEVPRQILIRNDQLPLGTSGFVASQHRRET